MSDGVLCKSGNRHKVGGSLMLDEWRRAGGAFSCVCAHLKCFRIRSPVFVPKHRKRNAFSGSNSPIVKNGHFV